MDSIWIVDSSSESASALSRSLARNGYDVLTVENEASLFVQLKVRRPDLIIMDPGLSDTSGFDSCKRLKKNEETKYIPVLMISAMESKNTLSRAFEAGADDFLSKTLDINVLLSKIKSLVRIKHLSDNLKEQYVELTEKNNILQTQLKMAMRVQRTMIKEVDISSHDIRIVSKYLPALDIGGDFYDIVPLNDDSLAIIIGDVSGHGISAALLTAMLNMMTKNYARQFFNPAQFLYYMNNALFKIFENSDIQMFACIFYAVIDTKKRRIYYSNAGQALPIYVSGADRSARELEISGAPLGMLEDASYENKVLAYDKGDTLFFYTDGFADNFYKDNPEEFYSRLKNMLTDMAEDAEPGIIINALLSVFYNYDIPDSMKYELDDVSLIVCKLGNPEAGG